MQDLFSSQQDPAAAPSAPLADRARPRAIEEVVGQERLLGPDGPLRTMFETGRFTSILFWGPPGVGKTTLALLIADRVDGYFVRLSAIEAGVKEVRGVIQQAARLRTQGRKTVLFIDEIHRFNKSQQDALLHAVEKGVITLIGATTENPSFEVNAALLSRCQVYRLQSLDNDQVRDVIERTLQNDPELARYSVEIADWDTLLAIAAGDVRSALNALELAVQSQLHTEAERIVIDRAVLEKTLQQKTARYDKQGDSHYDTISAFIKSMRGSDPDAALFWLAKMIDAGEDPKFIARRMTIFASEDIGNADPYALTLAISVFQSVAMVGMPEAQLMLAQGVTYLASCPKSNASYVAVKQALTDIRQGADVSVPLHLRNAPTKLMKQEGYGAEYRYPHDFPGHFVAESYFPESLPPKTYYHPGDFGREKAFNERLKELWPKRRDNEARS